MHEMAIAQEVLRSVLAAAAEHHADVVERVELAVGAMRLVVPESLELAWSVVSTGTPAAGSKLTILEVPLRARCRACRTAFDPRIDDFLCPRCRQADVDIVEGNDIILNSVTCRGREEPAGPRRSAR